MSKAKHQYLVVVRTNLDELPIGLYQNEGGAIAAINKLDPKKVKIAAKRMGVDNAGLVNAMIVTFTGSRPTRTDLYDLPAILFVGLGSTG